MASTATYNFNPPISNLTLMAFARVGIRRTEITTQHMADVDTESNLLQVEISNKVPNAWTAELLSITLQSGVATYDLPQRLVAIRDAYLTVSNGGVSTDRVIWGLSTQEYDAQPNKTQQAVPTMFFMNRLITPTITMWPVPDDSSDYILNIRMMSQLQDSSLSGGTTLNMPYRFIDVFVAGLAHRLSRIYAKDQEQLRKQDYMEAWSNASAQDLDDNISMLISPDLSGYYGRR